jgi:hypothetical protein
MNPVSMPTNEYHWVAILKHFIISFYRNKVDRKID